MPVSLIYPTLSQLLSLERIPNGIEAVKEALASAVQIAEDLKLPDFVKGFAILAEIIESEVALEAKIDGSFVLGAKAAFGGNEVLVYRNLLVERGIIVPFETGDPLKETFREALQLLDSSDNLKDKGLRASLIDLPN